MDTDADWGDARRGGNGGHGPLVAGAGGGEAPASEVILPQYLLANQGSELEGFEDSSDWTVASGTAVNNTTAGEFRVGTQSIKMTTPTGNDAVMTRAINYSPGASVHMRVSFYLYDADAANINRIIFTLNPSASGPVASMDISGIAHGDSWYTIDVRPDDWSAADWTQTFTELRITVRPLPGTSSSASLDTLRSGLVGVPAVMLALDDGYDDTYINAFPILKDNHARATVSVISGNVGAAGYMTEAQLLDLSAKNWSLANHSDSSAVNFAGMSQADVATHLNACRDYLDGLGLTGASKHVIYPGGVWEQATLDAMAAEGYLTGRHFSGGPARFVIDGNGDLDHLHSIERDMRDTLSLADAKAIIDAAIQYNYPVLLGGHHIGLTASANTWAIDDFQELIEYIAANDVPFITIEDWWASKTGAVTVPIKDTS